MQFIIQKKMALRQRINSLRAFLPMQHVRPQHLTFRFESQGGTSSEDNAAINVAEFERLIIDFVASCGVNPVHIIALGDGSKVSVARLLKFAHRLDCPTKVVLDGRGMTEDVVKELVYSGVSEISIVFGGISSKEHKANTGLDIEVSTEVLMMFLKHRADSSTKITIELHRQEGGRGERQAIQDWASEIGVDEVYAATGATYVNTSGANKSSSFIGQAVRRFSTSVGNRYLGWNNLWGTNCLFGGTRLEITETGQASCCPMRSPVPIKDRSIAQVWEQLREH